MDRGAPPGTRFTWQEAKERLEGQLRQADSLDSKAAALVGIHALAVGVLASLAGRFTGWHRWTAAGVVVGLACSGSFAFLAFRPQSYDRAPAPEELWRFADWGNDQILLRFLSTRFRALHENRQKLLRKSRQLAFSLSILWLLALAVAFVGVVELVE